MKNVAIMAIASITAMRTVMRTDITMNTEK